MFDYFDELLFIIFDDLTICCSCQLFTVCIHDCVHCGKYFCLYCEFCFKQKHLTKGLNKCGYHYIYPKEVRYCYYGDYEYHEKGEVEWYNYNFDEICGNCCECLTD